MQYSPHQLAYFAHQLTLRGAANSIDRMVHPHISQKWCAHASEYAAKHGQKPWSDLLTPHDAVAANVTLKNLAECFALRGRR